MLHFNLKGVHFGVFLDVAESLAQSDIIAMREQHMVRGLATRARHVNAFHPKLITPFRRVGEENILHRRGSCGLGVGIRVNVELTCPPPPPPF